MSTTELMGSATPVEYIPENLTPYEALDVSRIDAFQQQQWVQLTGNVELSDSQDVIDTKKEQFLTDSLPEMADAFMQASGISEDHPRYEDYKNLLVAHGKIDPYNEYGMYGWNYNGNSDDWTLREKYQIEFQKTFPETFMVLHDEAKERVVELSSKVSETFAGRMKGYFFNRKQKREDVLATRTEFDEAKKQLYELELQKIAAEGHTKAESMERLAEQSSLETSEQNDANHKALVESTWDGKYAEKYANLSRPKKMLAGAAIGLTVGAGIGASAMTLGAGGAVIAAAGTAGARAYRTYKTQKMTMYKNESEDVSKVEHRTHNGAPKDCDVFINELITAYHRTEDSRYEKADKIKRRALVMAIGAVGLGSLVGVVEHVQPIAGAFGSIRDHIGQAWDHLTDKFGSPGSGAKDIVQPPKPSVPEIPQPSSPQPDNTPDINIDYFGQAEIINIGEGWYQTFSELGVTNMQDQAILLNNDVLISKLANMGIAYPDSSIGGWGIRMTPDGKMPVEALKLIQASVIESISVK